MAALSVRLPCSGNAGPSGALSQFPSPCFPSAAYTPSFLSAASLQECHLGVCAFGLIPHSCSPHQDTRLVSHLSALTYVYFQPPEMHCPGRLPNSTLSGERERERDWPGLPKGPQLRYSQHGHPQEARMAPQRPVPWGMGLPTCAVCTNKVLAPWHPCLLCSVILFPGTLEGGWRRAAASKRVLRDGTRPNSL